MRVAFLGFPCTLEAMIFAVIVPYVLIGLHLWRLWAWRRYDKHSYMGKNDAILITGFQALVWPLMYPVIAISLEADRFMLPPRSERQKQKAAAAAARIRELEAELGLRS